MGAAASSATWNAGELYLSISRSVNHVRGLPSAGLAWPREKREGTVDLARRLLDSGIAPEHVSRGGRKAHRMGANG